MDILLARVRNSQSKIYFLDSVKAYKAGALRAAMTSVWVALVYDIIAKYRELGAMGDTAATAFLQSWDNATITGNIRKLLQLEASIIEDATKNTQVVNQIAGKHLERLREDRHLCAHPAFSAEAELFEPSPELVRLHLVNTVELVLSQEPLQGKAIFDLFDADVQSPGFPTQTARALDYVEQRYLERVRAQNVRNFGAVLAKSLLKGVPAQWESQRQKIVLSLVAVRERAASAWADVSQAIVRLIDNLDPQERPRAIAFIASFPDLWPLLLEPTRTALQQTVENVDPAGLTDFRIFSGLTVPQFRGPLTRAVATLNREEFAKAISAQPIIELWPRAIDLYRESGGWRASEANFRDLIAPFLGRLKSQQLEQLLDAILHNAQNWDAAETDQLLLSMLRNVDEADLPTPAARDRFYHGIRNSRRLEKYQNVFNLLQVGGWVPPPPAPERREHD
ncbi:MAG: hypothetical protein E6Q50_11225 [Lysobacter sp.]|nr:MAG: hypothetical protein E6Q50_11225 [Lysobacter sp.]